VDLPFSSLSRMQLQGNFSSKVTELVHLLKIIERDEPGEKALVFSSWTELLGVIASALEINHITFRYGRDRKTIAAGIER